MLGSNSNGQNENAALLTACQAVLTSKSLHELPGYPVFPSQTEAETSGKCALISAQTNDNEAASSPLTLSELSKVASTYLCVRPSNMLSKGLSSVAAQLEMHVDLCVLSCGLVVFFAVWMLKKMLKRSDERDKSAKSSLPQVSFAASTFRLSLKG
jgi:hypothetical protein